MWKAPLQTSWYETCKNRHFENWTNFFSKILKPYLGLFEMCFKKKKKKLKKVLKSHLKPGPGDSQKKN
jgi:hypothetical protein